MNMILKTSALILIGFLSTLNLMNGTTASSVNSGIQPKNNPDGTSSLKGSTLVNSKTSSLPSFNPRKEYSINMKKYLKQSSDETLREPQKKSNSLKKKAFRLVSKEKSYRHTVSKFKDDHSRIKRSPHSHPLLDFKSQLDKDYHADGGNNEYEYKKYVVRCLLDLLFPKRLKPSKPFKYPKPKPETGYNSFKNSGDVEIRTTVKPLVKKSPIKPTTTPPIKFITKPPKPVIKPTTTKPSTKTRLPSKQPTSTRPTTTPTTTTTTTQPTTTESPTTTTTTTEKPPQAATAKDPFYSTRKSECGKVPIFNRKGTRFNSTFEKVGSATAVHGPNAIRGEWPWIVQIHGCERRNLSNCSTCTGTLLNELWLITAGHCVADYQNSFYTFRAVFDSPGEVKGGSSLKARRIVQTVLHPDYEDMNNDIALLRMNRKVEYGLYIQPICLLPTTRNLFHFTSKRDCYMLGYESGSGRDGSRRVRSQRIQTGEPSNCNTDTLNETTMKIGTVCVSSIDNQTNVACETDSGGPNLCYDERLKVWQLFGVTSYVASRCERNTVSSVSVDLSNYCSWITESIG